MGHWLRSGQQIGRVLILPLTLLLTATILRAEDADFEPRRVTQWYPFVEWRIDGVTVAEGVNPFDVVAWAVFTHVDSGDTVRTGMFHDGDGAWRFRFTGTKPGRWTFETSSDDTDPLDGRRGEVLVQPNEDRVLGRGFVTHRANQWLWSGSGRAFVPQLVMASSIDIYHAEPSRIEADLDRWYAEHGFNGMHTGVAMRWYDIGRDRRDVDADVRSAVEIPDEGRRYRPIDEDPSPDPRTFESLERLITASYRRGGMVHLWKWGDEDRAMTPVGLAGGINGQADRRLQRYIAARLGPLPGWSMGYGFDLWEWVDEGQLIAWHTHMHQQMGWPHLLGGRTHRHGTPLEDLMTDRLDYIGYETHRPDLQTYSQALQLHPRTPVFMEDRFRVREPSPYPDKDYTPEMVRQGLWRSMMAGGVANIWGYQPRATGESEPFPNRDQIKTYATFHDRYFATDMVRDDQRTSGTCLRSQDQSVLLFYWEDEQTLRMDLSHLEGKLRAVAVNTREPYEEIEIDGAQGTLHWETPVRSDWAVAVTADAKVSREPRR